MNLYSTLTHVWYMDDFTELGYFGITDIGVTHVEYRSPDPDDEDDFYNGWEPYYSARGPERGLNMNSDGYIQTPGRLYANGTYPLNYEDEEFAARGGP